MTTHFSATHRKLRYAEEFFCLNASPRFALRLAATVLKLSSAAGCWYCSPDWGGGPVVCAALARKCQPLTRALQLPRRIYAPDAVYVELLPGIKVMRGRGEIRPHLDELLAAQTTDLSPTVASAEMTGSDAMSVSGDYVLTTKKIERSRATFFRCFGGIKEHG